jgi:hypothetical protein
VCPSTGTDIEVGPSGTTLLPLTVVNTAMTRTSVPDTSVADAGPVRGVSTGG